MAATPNTRRKNQQNRKNLLAAKARRRFFFFFENANRLLSIQAAQGAAASRSAEEPQNARLELSSDVAARSSRAQVLADETFDKEARRLAKAEENRPKPEERVEAERQALLQVAEEAERLAEESTRSVATTSNASPAPEVPASEAPAPAVDERAMRAAAERRDRELKEAALAEERRNLAELKAAQMEALARQRELEEREAADLRAELDLKVRLFFPFFFSILQKERERQRVEAERQAKEREAQAEQLRRQEEQFQAEQRDQLAKVEAAKRAQQAELQRQKEALEQLQRQAGVVAPVVSVPDDIAFTPIAPGKSGAASALDTPATLQIKEDLNIEAMLGQLDLDLDVTRPAAPPANKHLQPAAAAGVSMSRDSTARELEGLDNLMAGVDAFSFDTTIAATPAKPADSRPLNDSRTGGLTIRDPVKTEEPDVEAALGSVDFDRVTGFNTSSPQHPMRHEFSTVVAHDTAREVVDAAKAPAAVPAPATSVPAPAANAFDDFKLDTLDVTGTHISASQLDVHVNLDAIGASPAKAAAEEQRAAAAKQAAEQKAAEDKRAAEAAKTAAAAPAPEKKAEVIQDDKSKAGFGDKKAMFDAKPAAAPAGAAANGNKKNKKNNNKKKGKK